MNPAGQSRHEEPRSRVVIRFTEAAVRARSLVFDKFAIEVAECYFAMTSEAERVTKLRDPSQARNADHNAQVIRRYFSRTLLMFPADLEEAWVKCLPEPFRSDCARELARRYGFLGARAPAPGESVAYSLADLAREFGETVEAMAPILAAEHGPTRLDRICLQKGLKEMQDLMAALVSMQEPVVSALLQADIGASRA